MGKPSSNLGTSAVASVCTIEESHITSIAKKFRKGNTTEKITKDELNEAISSLEGIEEVDAELLRQMFVMFDVTGDGQVNHRDYTAGLCPLITGSAKEKLLLALRLFDYKRTGNMSRTEMRRILLAINNVVSYFGDPVVKDLEIGSLVNEIFKLQMSSSATLKYEDYFDSIYDHYTVQTFLLGKGKTKFGGEKAQ